MSVFDDALATILTDTDMTQAATYNGAAIRVDLRRDFVAMNGVESLQLVAEVLDSYVAAITHGDYIVISGSRYYVIGIHPQDGGSTILVLSTEVSA